MGNSKDKREKVPIKKGYNPDEIRRRRSRKKPKGEDKKKN